MKTRIVTNLAVVATAALLLQGAVLAQNPTKQGGHMSTTTPHHGILSFLHKPAKTPPVYGGPGQYGKNSPVKHHTLLGGAHSHPMIPSHSSPIGSGQFIGNKNTHVLHAPGSKGTLPAEKNRVYFKTEAAAEAAGYHLAK